jgi:hypothetical protein
METTIATKNIGRPAPRWYRIAKRITYLAQAGGIFGGVFTRFGVSAEDQLLIVGCVTTLLELLSMALGSNEDYIVNENGVPKAE